MSSLKDQLLFELCDNLDDSELHKLLATIVDKLERKHTILEISQQLLHSVTEVVRVADKLEALNTPELEIVDIAETVTNALIDRLTVYVDNLAQEHEQAVNNDLLN